MSNELALTRFWCNPRSTRLNYLHGHSHAHPSSRLHHQWPPQRIRTLARISDQHLRSQCPTSHQESSSVHNHYHRTVTDLPIADLPIAEKPIAEKPVLLKLPVRRLCCQTPTCPQRIFCERLTDPIVHARRTKRQVNTLVSMTVKLGGRAATRLGSLKLLGARTTLLNALKAMPLPIVNKPRIIGVEDFAFKRDHTYGTVIVDLETHKPIDLLPDRQASTLITWSKAHPSVKIVTRDRAKEYAQAISQGAPRAKQIVDRFLLTRQHLLDHKTHLSGMVAGGLFALGIIRRHANPGHADLHTVILQYPHVFFTGILAFSYQSDESSQV